MVVKENLCWYCQKNPATHTFVVNLEKKEWIDATHFTINKMTVPIPRCEKCRSNKKNLTFLFWLAIGIPGAAFMYLIQSPSKLSLNLMIASAGVSVVLFILAFFRMKNNSSKSYGHHPEVKAAVKNGYRPTTIV